MDVLKKFLYIAFPNFLMKNKICSFFTSESWRKIQKSTEAMYGI
ncbi:hypothetical protein M127_4865 [Bacteroides fragilis str. S6L5]|nr:hypothetical protein M127_4865 [Bacteroides fragilis str. S6L5]